MHSSKFIRWFLIGVAVVSITSIAGLLIARSLQPRQQQGLLNRLPEFIQPLARSLILPAYPDTIAAPVIQSTVDVASLLTPIPTQPVSDPPTVAPTSAPPTLAPIQSTDAPPVAPLEPTVEPIQPTNAPLDPASLTPVIPPGAVQAARSTPARLEGANVLLTGFNHTYQSWNNCGPATLSTNLSFFGWDGGQSVAADFLKPDPEDKNVSPHELAAFAQSNGFNAAKRANGSMQLIKEFLHAGVPVLVEKGFEPEVELGWMGHYQLVIGYDDDAQEFIAMDSYTGPNQSSPYDAFDRYWSHFNRTFVVVYTDDQSDMVMNLLGADADPVSNIAAALVASQAEAAIDPANAFAWFNIGTNLVDLGDYESAAAAYDQARNLGLPWRMTWYQFNIFEAYYHTARYDDVLELADATLSLTPYIEELWYYRGLVYQARGDFEAARAQFNQALVYNKNFRAAADALATLSQ